MENLEQTMCEQLLTYMAGEGSDVERKRFERHLQQCADCRNEYADLRDIWDRIADEAKPLDVPEDLKAEVMEAVFAGQTEENLPTAQDWAKRSSFRMFVRWGAVAVAIAAAFIGGIGWQASRSSEPIHGAAQNAASDRIESIYTLASVPDNGQVKMPSRSYGVACLVHSNSQKQGQEQLVVYLFGTPATNGNEVYQVWLWDDGNRRSAGTFKVGQSGIGILTVPMNANRAAIDAIGVTLEPNGPSSVPQGPKLYGSEQYSQERES